jgi:ketosteroid isomerase-like protein
MTDARERGRLHASEELRSITERYWAAFRRGDSEAVIARTSRMDGITLIGTDETEYIDDPDAYERYTKETFEALPTLPVGEAQIDAWSQGDVGWAVVRSTVEATSVQALRATIIYHLEHDEWKIVHAHYSVGVPNETAFGTPLTFSLDRLVEAVESERPDVTAAAASDGTVTLVFTDIEGSTALNASFGDVGWIEVLRVHNEIVARLTTLVRDLVSTDQEFRFGPPREVELKGIDGLQRLFPLAPG